VAPIRYAGDDKNGYSTDDEPHLSPDDRTLYFSSDRAVPAHFPTLARASATRFQAPGQFGLV
jgi:hypothetical protein